MRRNRSEDESYEYFDYYLEENLGWLSINIFNINISVIVFLEFRIRWV